MTDQQPEYTVVETRLATPREKFYLGLADDAIRQTIPRLNDALTRLITLTTAMSGGALLFLRDDVCTGWGRMLAASCFFLSLAAAVVGAIPHNPGLGHEVPDIEAALDRTARVKKVWVWVSSGLLLAGLFFAILGVGLKA